VCDYRLIGKDGKVKGRWASTTKPEALEKAILAELEEKTELKAWLWYLIWKFAKYGNRTDRFRNIPIIMMGVRFWI
jgi:hypothetical protein